MPEQYCGEADAGGEVKIVNYEFQDVQNLVNLFVHFDFLCVISTSLNQQCSSLSGVERS